jgi:hypothetical protein
MSSNIFRSLQTAKTFSRLNITSNEEFTIPETASLFCSGGGIFRKGITVGNSNSIIPGSLRFVNNQLQYRTSNGWINMTGFINNDNDSSNSNNKGLSENISIINNKENSILKFGSNGELKDTPLCIENSNITGVELLETEYIVPPDNKNLIIGNIQWPTTNGDKNHTLRFLSSGILEPSQGPVPIYDISVGINKLIYFENNNGKLLSSNISVLNENLTGINVLSGIKLIGGNVKIFSNTIYGSSGLTIVGDNGNIGLTPTTNNNVNLSTYGTGIIKLNSSFINTTGKLNIVNTENDQKINFLTLPPTTSTSPGSKGDFAWTEDYIYICVFDNVWKRTPLSSW